MIADFKDKDQFADNELSDEELANVCGGEQIGETKSYYIYRIEKGDNLEKIGRRYGVSAKRIFDFNDNIKNINFVTRGQVIKIPKLPR